MKPRPTAADRELADVFRKLSVGTHMVTVIDTAASLMFDHRPVLKSEGTTVISLEGKTIYVGVSGGLRAGQGWLDTSGVAGVQQAIEP